MKRSIKELLSDISKGNGPSLIVLHGEDFHLHEASKKILDLLVPMEQRSLNLERFDGRSTSWDQIETAIRIPPLFSGRKTILIENAPYFLSRERKGDLVDKVLQLWGDEKKDEAARLFLDFLALEGWSQEQLERAQAPESESQIGALLGTGGKGGDKELEAVFAFACGRGMDLRHHRAGQNQGLLEIIDEGLPPWVVLLISASHVDRRIRLYRRLEQEGVILDLGIEREKSGRIKRETLAEFMDQRVREAGKRMEPRARNMILARAGDELWGFHQEMEKLLIYVGEKPSIAAQDVEEIFLDQAGAWVFDLTASIAQRDTLQALAYLKRLLFQGEPPLRLLGTIASDVRRLLAARHFMEGELRQKWKRDMTFQEFQRNVIGQKGTLLTQNPYADYMSFQRADPFTTRELVRCLQLIYQTDVRLKSTARPTRMVMERLILEMCQGQDERAYGIEGNRQ